MDMKLPAHRVLHDGSLYFLKRAPDEVPGYEMDPNDPCRFVPILCECPMRQIKEIKVPNCKCTKIVQFCNKLGLPITLQYCNQDCKEPERVPFESTIKSLPNEANS